MQAAFVDSAPSLTSDDAASAMQLALQWARRGPRGANPLVGAVLLPSSACPIAGFHAGPGTAHAEAAVLDFAYAHDIDTTGATLVVTLEPCTHTGRTGPCTQRILDAGVSRVVIATADPNPSAAGGAALLHDVGVEVELGLGHDEAFELNDRWFVSVNQSRPFITGKIAQSLDGKVAAADGTSQWITSEESRNHAHQIRAVVDAIGVGTGTVVADNPRLTARPVYPNAGGDNAGHTFDQPIPIVIGITPLPDDAHLAHNTSTVVAPTIDEALDALHAKGVGHLLVEGGPGLLGSFLARDLIDELHLYQAPMFLGPGLSSITGLPVDTLSQARRFVLDTASANRPNPQLLGPDTFTRLKPIPAANERRKDTHVYRNR